MRTRTRSCQGPSYIWKVIFCWFTVAGGASELRPQHAHSQSSCWQRRGRTLHWGQSQSCRCAYIQWAFHMHTFAFRHGRSEHLRPISPQCKSPGWEKASPSNCIFLTVIIGESIRRNIEQNTKKTDPNLLLGTDPSRALSPNCRSSVWPSGASGPRCYSSCFCSQSQPPCKSQKQRASTRLQPVHQAANQPANLQLCLFHGWDMNWNSTPASITFQMLF